MNEWKRVWRCIDERRIALGWSKAKMYRETSTSERTFVKMSEGVPIARPAKRRQIEAAIGWAAGSIDTALEGGDPVEVARPDVGPEAVSRLDVLERETAALRQAVRELQADVRFLLDDEQRRPSTGDGDGASEAGR